MINALAWAEHGAARDASPSRSLLWEGEPQSETVRTGGGASVAIRTGIPRSAACRGSRPPLNAGRTSGRQAAFCCRKLL